MKYIRILWSYLCGLLYVVWITVLPKKPLAKVEGNITNSIIGPKVVIEEGANVIDSVIFSNVVIKKGATVNYSIIDENVEIGENATVGASKDEGIKIAVIGRGVKVYNDAIVENGANIEEDVRKEK